MNKFIYPLLVAQFLSVFADNMILFTVIAMVMHTEHIAGWYVPALQSVFLIAFVVLAPWVGVAADTHAKARVLIAANLVKALGTGLLLLNVDPLIAYCVVGIGAAAYSPAKYGILPELAGHQVLVKANSWIEGSTILAMLSGMGVGAVLADASVERALYLALALLLISAAINFILPVTVSKPVIKSSKIMLFYQEICSFMAHPRTRFTVFCGSLFWGAAAAVRVILIAWAPIVLDAHNASDISDLTLFLALGIIAGAVVVPRLIPLEHLRRVRIAAYIMGGLIITLGLVSSVLPARIVLLLMGTAGGIFIVPINAAMQEMGQQSIGSGGAVAMQNFFQNAAMLSTVGLYTLAAAQQVNPIHAFLVLGGTLMLLMLLLMRRMPAHLTQPASPE
jgi:MFS transporter, LPLT family, lysophospholipid transporter